MTNARTTSLRSSEIAVGDQLPRFDLPVTSTVIVAGAIASRDFMPAHHDAEFAKAQGAPDMFMIKIRLGAPAVPGQPLRFSGQVVGTSREGDECLVEVAVRAANDLGDHATGSVVVSLPHG
jgi:hypothetical protein